jgi:signal transduction histidine kinase
LIMPMDKNDLKPEVLQQSMFLASLPAEQLAWLVQNGELVTIEDGQELINSNVLQDAFYVVIDGEFEVSRGSDQEKVVLAVQGCGQILGEMSAIAGVLPTATVRALVTSQVLKIKSKTFNQLILNNPATAMDLLRTAMVRLRNTEAMLNQREKLASLGTLAAGLAHELNNPAAAARRSAGQLRQTINAWFNTRIGLDSLNLDPRLNEIVINQLRASVAGHDHTGMNIDPLERSDRESEIEDWLVTRGMDDAWEYAPSFVTFDWRPSSLEAWCAEFDPAQVPVILRWLATGYVIHILLDEILHSSERVSEIVAAVKSYAYLDEAPKKEIDIHEGLENTLVILKHKIKQGITVERSYDRSLPRIEAYGSELNQVWTNLMDNAIDAMNGEGVLRVRTYERDDCLVVEIGDNGPGIPSTVLPHIFEPFYTTKEPGKGTGLGLHVTNLIVQKHRGKIEVKSQPGDTRFIVSLPYKKSPDTK